MTRCMHLLATACAIAAASPAGATSFCLVNETRDDFVALRAGPSAEARLVARMKAGDEVKLVGSPQGAWHQVEWWRGDERLRPPGRKARAAGWVNRRLIDECGMVFVELDAARLERVLQVACGCREPDLGVDDGGFALHLDENGRFAHRYFLLSEGPYAGSLRRKRWQAEFSGSAQDAPWTKSQMK